MKTNDPDTRTREKRTLLTRGEEREIQVLLREILDITGLRVNYSELCRAALTVVLQHEEKFLAELDKAGGQLKKPQTSNLQEAFDFEFGLAEMIRKAVRRR